MSIGDGAVIGTGAIVTKNIPAYSIAVGVPAKVIKKRFPQHIIDQLSEIDWWNWSDEKIKSHHKLFSKDLTTLSKQDFLLLIKE